MNKIGFHNINGAVENRDLVDYITSRGWVRLSKVYVQCTTGLQIRSLGVRVPAGASYMRKGM